MAERPHRRLTKCHVLFLGDSTPEESTRGIKSLQQPLMKCYPVDNPSQVEGIDSWITIFTSGILLQYVGNKNDRPMPIWFPIQNLYIAAATKCINYLDSSTGERMDTEFVDINHSAAEQSSHPPLFSIIVRKTSGKRILRCYTFLVRDEEPAVAMVDAAKYAFTHESGWSNAHPPEQVIRNELVAPTDDSDGIDEFDSVSATNHRANQKGKSPNGNRSQDISDSDAPSGTESKRFPSHLVKKYTLTNTNRAGTSPTRRPIPAEFMYGSPADASVRSSRHRAGPPIPPHMIMNGSPAIPAGLAGSLRTTSTVRVINDPRLRTPLIERVIRERVPVPVPVYQPAPPPQIIREVKPVYIPQPPEIRHVPVDREVPVPVEVPVPYPIDSGPQFYDERHHPRSRGSKRSQRHKSHKHHHTFKIFDDRFARREPDRPSFFVNPDQPYNFASPVANGFFEPPGEHYRARGHGKQQSRSYRRGRSHSSSGSSSSGSEERRHGDNRYSKRGIEITELGPSDDRERSSTKHPSNRHSDFHIRQLEKRANDFNIREVNNHRDGNELGNEFKWSAMPQAQPTKEQRKAERRSRREERKSREFVEATPDYTGGRVYQGADPVERVGDLDLRPSTSKQRSSFNAFRQNEPLRNDERRDKKKEKKKRDKTPSRHELKPDYDEDGSKEYYFKEHTENPPRNWMDQQKEYMNERAFSSSLANDHDAEITNAYALNKGPDDDDMFDRSMPAPVPYGGIPVPPPLPPELQAGGRATDDLY